MEPKTLDTFTRVMGSQATVDATACYGVKRETVKAFFLDKEVRP
jgi:hypothetical protein